MLIKNASKELKLKSPQGSFVSFGLFVFLKKSAVCVLKNTRFVVDPLTNGK